MNRNGTFSTIRTRFLRVFFYLLYHHFAWMYDLVATMVSLGKWKHWIMTTVPYLQGPRVLELGHGPGHLIQALQTKGIQVYGLDESKYMGLLTARRLEKGGYRLILIRGYAQSLPVKSQSIHQVVATFPSEFISNPDTLMEIHRVLVQGGKFVLLPFVQITGKNLADRATAWLFDITGQSPQWDDKMLTPLAATGFQTTLESFSTNSWSLFIIIAKKL